MSQSRNDLKSPSGNAANAAKAANAAEGGWEPEHRAVDRRLREYARHRSALDAAEALDLVRAEQFKLYAHVGCCSHYDYMDRILGYGPHAARERMRVARALVRLPATMAAMSRGELSYSAVRELTRVATNETETEWLVRAKGLVVNQIEKLVAHHQPGDRPDDPTRRDLRPRMVRLELPTEVYALWRQARMVVAEARGSEVSDADVMEALDVAAALHRGRTTSRRRRIRAPERVGRRRWFGASQAEISPAVTSAPRRECALALALRRKGLDFAGG